MIKDLMIWFLFWGLWKHFRFIDMRINKNEESEKTDKKDRNFEKDKNEKNENENVINQKK